LLRSPSLVDGKSESKEWGITGLTPNFVRWSITRRAWDLSLSLSFLKWDAIPGKFYNSNQVDIYK
jgi:hypothetical protein